MGRGGGGERKSKEKKARDKENKKKRKKKELGFLGERADSWTRLGNECEACSIHKKQNSTKKKKPTMIGYVNETWKPAEGALSGQS